MKKLTALILAALVLLSGFSAFAVKPEISSISAILIDAETGQVLFEKDKDKKVYPASITKVLTVYLGEKALDGTELICASEEVVDTVPKDSTNIAIDYGEVLTSEQAMYATMLMSANDAANMVAEGVSGSISEFVKLMNTTAQEFGAESTNFANANGLPDDNHYTTASDFAKIVKGVSTDPEFLKIFGALEYTIPSTNKKAEPRNFVAKHRMLRLEKYADCGVIGGKTGYTTKAQHTAATLAEKDGKRFIAVVFGSSDMGTLFSETEAILHHGYDDFVKTTVTKEEVGIKEEGNLRYTPIENATFYLPNNYTKNDITTSFTDSGVVICDKEGNILANMKVEVTEIVTKSQRVFRKVLTVIVVLVVLMFVLSWYNRRRRRIKRRKERWQKERAELMGEEIKK
ncbi:MAG: D-alanyl-D-alanine carboxypeptidase [Clostridia bacterium]|nr:D-alanyl-D-alanine carboxypeptidase [Clostridia bacterium]